MTWWADLYDELVEDTLLDAVDHRTTMRTVELLNAVLELDYGDRVFDQCCGTGRLAIELAVRHRKVVGVEQSARYVGRAEVEAYARRCTPELHVGDAFTFVADPPCKGAFNWWTGFGYLEDDAGNARMLDRAFESLVPGGRYVLDFPNAPQLLRTFRPDESTQGARATLHRASTVDLARGLLHKRWTFTCTDGRVVERPSTLRLYHPHELVRLFEAAGFTELRLYGDVDRQDLGLDSPRCIVVGRRP
jgi:SAM-dependent methyltransferase